MTIKNIVLVGAGGTLGREVLKHFLNEKTFEVTVLARPQSETRFPSGVRVIRDDQTPDNLRKAFANQDAVVCMTGVSAIGQQKDLIDAAVSAGVRRFILNEYGNPPDAKTLPDLEFARKSKLDITNYAKEQAAAHPDFTWCALVTGHFLDLAIIKFPRIFGFDIKKHTARLVDDGVEPFSATTMADIAIAIAGALKHPDETANQYVQVRSTETTQREILAAFEAQTGVKWVLSHVSSSELLKQGRQVVASGSGNAIPLLLPAQLFEKGSGRWAVPADRLRNVLLGVQEKTAEEIVRDVLRSERSVDK